MLLVAPDAPALPPLLDLERFLPLGAGLDRGSTVKFSPASKSGEKLLCWELVLVLALLEAALHLEQESESGEWQVRQYSVGWARSQVFS